jgi:hypothetical protein
MILIKEFERPGDRRSGPSSDSNKTRPTMHLYYGGLQGRGTVCRMIWI